MTVLFDTGRKYIRVQDGDFNLLKSTHSNIKLPKGTITLYSALNEGAELSLIFL